MVKRDQRTGPIFLRGGACHSLQHTDAFKVLEDAAMVFYESVFKSVRIELETGDACPTVTFCE